MKLYLFLRIYFFFDIVHLHLSTHRECQKQENAKRPLMRKHKNIKKSHDIVIFKDFYAIFTEYFYTHFLVWVLLISLTTVTIQVMIRVVLQSCMFLKMFLT